MDPQKNKNLHDKTEDNHNGSADDTENSLPPEGTIRYVLIAERFSQIFATVSWSAMEDILRLLIHDSFVCTTKSGNGGFTAANSVTEQMTRNYYSHYYPLIIGESLEMIRQWNLNADDIMRTMDIIVYLKYMEVEETVFEVYQKYGSVFFLTPTANYAATDHTLSDSSSDDEEQQDK